MSDIPVETYLSQSSDFTTNTVFLRGYNGFATQIIVTNGSTFSATAYIQMSNDDINWVTLTADSISLAGASDVALFDVPITGASFYRVSIVFIGGSADFKFIYNCRNF